MVTGKIVLERAPSALCTAATIEPGQG